MLQLTTLGKSFMYIKNKRGPKFDPCGTPYSTVRQLVWNERWFNELFSFS